MSERLSLRNLGLVTALALGLAACSDGNERISPKETGIGGEDFRTPDRSVATGKAACRMSTDTTIKPGEAVWVQAGLTAIGEPGSPDYRVYSRMVYGRDGNTLGLPTDKLTKPGDWTVANIVEVNDVTMYARQEVKPANDACMPPEDEKRPSKNAQLVTVIGELIVNGSRYPSFNDGTRHVDSLQQAVESGAIGVPFEKVPSDYYLVKK